MCDLQGLTIFDLDGTLIRVNSFREISKRFILRLLKKGYLFAFVRVLLLYVLRKCGLRSHMNFKKSVVDLFENILSEPEKQCICESVFNTYVNKAVFCVFLNAPAPIVSTASPHAFISRMPLPSHTRIISALHPNDNVPDKSNFGRAKFENLKSYLNINNIRIDAFFTDSLVDDKPLIDISEAVFLVFNGCLERYK